MLYSQVTAMNAQEALVLLVAPGGNMASMIVAMIKKRQLNKLPPIIAQRRPTLSIHAIHAIWASNARTDEIPWYWNVCSFPIPICSKMTGE